MLDVLGRSAIYKTFRCVQWVSFPLSRLRSQIFQFALNSRSRTSQRAVKLCLYSVGSYLKMWSHSQNKSTRMTRPHTVTGREWHGVHTEALCACVRQTATSSLSYSKSSPVCVCANASMHVCDLSLIIWRRMLTLLLSQALSLQRQWYHLAYLNIPSVKTLGSLPSPVRHQVSPGLILNSLHGDKGVSPALSSFAVLVVITGLSEEVSSWALPAVLYCVLGRQTNLEGEPWPLPWTAFNLFLVIFQLSNKLGSTLIMSM